MVARLAELLQLGAGQPQQREQGLLAELQLALLTAGDQVGDRDLPGHEHNP